MSDQRQPGGAPPRAPRFPRDLVAGAVILLFCAVSYWVTLGFARAPAAIAQNVQPATFPRLVIATIALLTVVMMALSFTRESRPKTRVPLLVPASAALMIGFVFAFETLGIGLAMILFCVALPLLWGERRWRFIVPFALLFPGAVYAVFALVFEVHFDPGVLTFD